MKTPIIICALTLSIALLNGQNESKTSTIRIEKTENINGLEKKLDTTIYYTGPIYLKSTEGSNSIENIENASNQTKKIIIISDDISGDEKNLKTINISEEINEIIQKAIVTGDADGKTIEVDKVIELNTNEKSNLGNCDKNTTHMMITKKINIVDANEGDLKLIGKENSLSENKLGIEKMNFYPNPSSGKFNLSFTLPQKKETEVSIVNIEGKNIYQEKISNFSGGYNKEIDISNNPKGIYFVKISQGKNTQTKKIVIE